MLYLRQYFLVKKIKHYNAMKDLFGGCALLKDVLAELKTRWANEIEI